MSYFNSNGRLLNVVEINGSRCSLERCISNLSRKQNLCFALSKLALINYYCAVLGLLACRPTIGHKQTVPCNTGCDSHFFQIVVMLQKACHISPIGRFWSTHPPGHLHSSRRWSDLPLMQGDKIRSANISC